MAKAKKTKEPPVAGSGINLNVLIYQPMLEEIEDYRFKERFPSRVEALRALIQIGLDSSKKRA